MSASAASIQADAVRQHSAAIIKATLQGCVLTAVSNILAQVLTQHRAPGNAPITINPTPILHFILLTILNTPPNFIWQEYLESSFPGHDAASAVEASEKKSSPPPPSLSKNKQPTTKGSINVTNTLIKFALDQSLGAIYNTVIFLAVMQAFRGASAEQIWEVVRRDSYHLMAAGMKVWPAVSLLSFTVVPPRQRLLFGSLVGMGWNIFLALFMSG